MRNDFETGYLMHWGIKKGGKKENHKYYERVEKNGKYLYFYTQAEYEAWLNKGNKALDKTKNKAKGALSSLKSKFSNTKSSLLNAIGQGRSAAYQLANRSQTQLTKKNAQKAIDRGNKIISSILNTTQKQVSNTVSSVQKNSKAVSANASKKANSIVSKVTNTLKKAGKDTAKAVQKYISKGEKTIKQTLAKAGNVKLEAASKKVGGIGTAIIASLAATAVVAAAKFIYDKIEEKRWERYWEKQQERRKREEQQREAEGRKKEIDARNEARKVEQRRKELQEGLAKKFSNDAEDSVKEDYIRHNDIPLKDEATSKTEDMMAVNQGNFTQEDVAGKIDEYQAEYDKWFAKYEETGDYKYYEKAESIYDEMVELYYNNYGYLNNCANCTLTYDLRRRGYDVDAPWNHEGTYTDTITDWYKLDANKDVEYWESNNKRNDWAPFEKEEATEIVTSMADQYPEGSYGHFLVQWSSGGGHDCVWSKEGGKIIIRDCQTGRVVNPQEYLQRAYEVSYFRADDKELSDLVYDNIGAESMNENGKNSDDDWWYESEKRSYEEYKRKRD